MDVNQPSIQHPTSQRCEPGRDGRVENDGVWQNRLLRVPVWCSSFLANFVCILGEVGSRVYI